MSALTRVLLVEDDEADAALIIASLKKSGLNIEYQRVWSRSDLALSLTEQPWDVVLSDYNLPQFDGLSALTMVKAHDPDIPFIIVSGAIGEETAVASMRCGAHDFVMKNSLGRLGTAIVRELSDADIRRSARIAAHNLQANEALLNSIINTAADGIAVLSLDGKVEFANPALSRMIGYAPAELLGIRFQEILKNDPVDSSSGKTLLDLAITNAEEPANLQIQARARDGRSIPVEIRISQMTINAASKFTIVIRDISERTRSEERMWHLTHFDELSGLPNRLLFRQLLEQSLRNAKRDSKSIVVLYIDLDRFKLINDTAGHDNGDEVLREVTNRLRKCLRESDLVSRFSGDEFAAMICDVEDPGAARAAATRILDALSRPYYLNGEDYHLTASIGISSYPSDSTDASILLRNAEQAMHRTKDQGKNNFQFHSPQMNARSSEHVALERALRLAVERNEFQVHYQPQVNTASGHVIGAEALLRWKRPDIGMVAPDKFIPLAEETGLIVPIGRIVMQQACTEARRWQNAGHSSFRIAINLSPRQFIQSELINDVQRILVETGLAPDSLELEITEGMVMDNPERAAVILLELRALGVQLAIDDFGTGYSSLGYLKRFPVNTIKIDRSFIRDIPANADDVAITDTIIAMGRSLRLNVVAEGVETEAQAEFLRIHGCHMMQGYLICRPVPAADLDIFLHKNPIWNLQKKDGNPN